MSISSWQDAREEARQLVFDQLKALASDLEHQFPRKYHVCFDYREEGDFVFMAIIPAKFNHNRGWEPVFEAGFSMNDAKNVDNAIERLSNLLGEAK